MHPIEQNWEVIKDTIRKEYDLSPISYNTWIEPLKFYEVKDDTVVILIPSNQAHALKYITNKYSSFFKVTISEIMDHNYEISFLLEKDAKKDPEPGEVLKSPENNTCNM